MIRESDAGTSVGSWNSEVEGGERFTQERAEGTGEMCPWLVSSNGSHDDFALELFDKVCVPASEVKMRAQLAEEKNKNGQHKFVVCDFRSSWALYRRSDPGGLCPSPRYAA